MLIVSLKKLQKFSFEHASARKSLQVWKDVTEKAVWKNKQDVLRDFPKAKMIKKSRARFEFLHNQYRLIAYIDFLDGLVFIRFIGTHTEYDNINPETI